MEHHDDTLLTAHEAAAMLRLSVRTMERARVTGAGPRYIALGRAIRYRRRDLWDFIERASRRSTSERSRDNGQSVPAMNPAGRPPAATEPQVPNEPACGGNAAGLTPRFPTGGRS
jgi:hypothetical protein